MTNAAPLWPQVVSAALLGTATRPVSTAGADPALAPHLGALPADTPPAELVLHTAALTAVATNAQGPLPAPGPEPVPTAAHDPRPPLSPRLAAVVHAALSLPGAERWCLAPVAASGLRSPARLLPDLLLYTADRPEAGPAVAALTGPRGAWLARIAPDIKARLGTGTGAGPMDDGIVPAQADWDALRAPERAQVLQDLGPVTPGSDAESLCERGLDDRTATVRAAAVRALSGSAGTAYERRMRSRASAVVRRRRTLRGERIEVAPADPPDPAAVRDGVAWPPPQGVSPTAQWVAQLATALPLSAWEELLDATPDRLVGASGDYTAEFRSGWRERTAREREPRWAAALAQSGEPADLALLPGPWPDTLSERVIRVFATIAASDDRRPLPPGDSALIAAAAEHLPAATGAPWPQRVADLAARGTTSRTRYLAPLAEILRLRTVIEEELP
ncbi:DUF5691 domain-containing protein [Tsukamurella paurometabola]|uniref:Uncharacterized protein n=1 Tax=Tsukamurella paurometabola TaxID=2061 RepID=A0A3P8L9H3_TSUPA|nr:DUF5691 domain-containing protein [Tsukamurella paurometabola]MBS4099706.1 hypothetical protein [Tsukamurella paurometabola]UEA83712.1 DUF5691 domain-containing protein [Tsukamurella paurometabola]VDR40851.1 Uncharacterised protein [Tsukamurella paurometabola]